MNFHFPTEGQKYFRYHFKNYQSNLLSITEKIVFRHNKKGTSHVQNKVR